MRVNIKIKHGEWLKFSSPQKSIDLFNNGIMPDKIAGWMIVTGLKHPLRAVYGSDLRAALALLWQALTQGLWHRFLTLRYRLELTDADEVNPAAEVSGRGRGITD